MTDKHLAVTYTSMPPRNFHTAACGVTAYEKMWPEDPEPEYELINHINDTTCEDCILAVLGELP